MKKLWLALFVLSIPCMLTLTAAQGARYYAATVELRRLEASQADWIEENRRLLANIAVARSRSRVDASMAGAEGYRMVSPKTTLRIRVIPGMEKRDG
ncbi:MAG: cell division protein FtsL [Spirochaetes bacterium]|nr:cell division protein FtsL [Spirochaetota bacterium]MBU1079961.1 cell division protein FtsL [Spirochaetota bacterium]